MKKILAFILLFIFCPVVAWAACTNNGDGTFTTGGNESSDVMDCINHPSLVAGNTINVIAGDEAATWAAGSVVVPSNKPLKIMGPGRDNLTIILGGHYPLQISTDGATPYIGTVELPATRISGFTFQTPTDAGYAAILARGKGWRIDNCRYHSVRTTNAQTAAFVNAYSMNQTAAYVSVGLIDNNIIINGHIDSGMLGSFTALSTPWADPLDLGTANFVYVEDNVFNAVNTNYQMYLDSNGSGKYVSRYNTFNDGRNLVHSLQDDWRGSISWEMYGNIFNALTSNVGIAPLAGTGVVFNNYMAGSGGTKNISFDTNRLWKSVGSHALKCDGTSDYDGNTTVTPSAPGYPCRDQLGRSTDSFLWTSASGSYATVFPAPVQELKPAYLWSNYSTTTPIVPNVSVEATNYIVNNRDYYIQNASFNGTSGVGCGTLGNRPATCTTGVGYWATNQSCSDMTGMVGANPSTPIAGTLYKCTSTNTWTEYYTPYDYPHPLRGEVAPPDSTPPTVSSVSVNAAGTSLTITFDESVNFGAGGNGGFVLDPSGADVTLTYASGAGTASLVYTISRPILQSETMTLAYTQPTAGVEDVSALTNDLASFTGRSVGNQSTQTGEATIRTLTLTTGTGVAGMSNYPTGITFADGTAVTVSAACHNGWRNAVYSGDCNASTGNVTMSANRSCSATCSQTPTLNWVQ
jgi:hypothetical protein